MSLNDEFLTAFLGLPIPTATEVEYRLHYNAEGRIYLCTQADHPEDTEYLVVDKDTYDNYFRYTVVDKKLNLVDTHPKESVKLKRSSQGYAVVKDHAGILLEPGEEYTNIEYYESNN